MMAQLTYLPPELILHIYNEVPRRQRKELRLLCPYFNSTLREEVLSGLRIDIHASISNLACDISAFQNLIRTTRSRKKLSMVMVKPPNGFLVKAPTSPSVEESTLGLLSNILYSVRELRSFSWTLHYGASRHGIPLLVDWMKQLKGLREINLLLMDHIPSLKLGLHPSSMSSLTKLKVVSTGSKSMFNEGTLIDDVAAIVANAPQLREIHAIQDSSIDIFANVVHNSSRTNDAAVLFSRVRRDRAPKESALRTLVLEGHSIRCLTPNMLFYIRSLCHFSYLPPEKPPLSTYGYYRGHEDLSPPIWKILDDERLYQLQTLKTTALNDALWPFLSKSPFLKRLHLIAQPQVQDRQGEILLENFREIALPALAHQLEELVVTVPYGNSCWCFDSGIGDALNAHVLRRLKSLEVTLSAPAGDCLDWNRCPSVVQIYSSKGLLEWQPNVVLDKIEAAKEKWENEGCDLEGVWTQFIEQIRAMPALTSVTIQPPCQGARHPPFHSEKRHLEMAEGILRYKKEVPTAEELYSFPTIVVAPMLFQPYIRDGQVRYQGLTMLDNLMASLDGNHTTIFRC